MDKNKFIKEYEQSSFLRKYLSLSDYVGVCYSMSKDVEDNPEKHQIMMRAMFGGL